MNDSSRTSVLFVCLGNICRSPLAEGVMDHLAAEEGVPLAVDSAGTGAWHVGERPDARSITVAEAHGISLEGRARSVRDEDFHEFDYVVAMDRSNLTNLKRMSQAVDGSAALHLLREFDPEARGDLEVPDPYYGGASGFDDVFEMVERSCHHLLAHILSEARPDP